MRSSKGVNRSVERVDFKPNPNSVVYAYSVGFPFGALAEVENLIPGFKLVKILTPSDYTDIVWPLDIVGMSLSFDFDAYETRYKITGFDSDDAVIVEDTLSTLVDGGVYEWQVMGYKKEQKLSISSMVLHFAFLGSENQSYPGAKSNAGPGNGGANP